MSAAVLIPAGPELQNGARAVDAMVRYYPPPDPFPDWLASRGGGFVRQPGGNPFEAPLQTPLLLPVAIGR